MMNTKVPAMIPISCGVLICRKSNCSGGMVKSLGGAAIVLLTADTSNTQTVRMLFTLISDTDYYTLKTITNE